MCGSNDNSAKKALKWQKKQAADAAKKEAERKARLEAGTKTINSIFDGDAVMAEREATYDWKSFTDAAGKASGPTWKQAFKDVAVPEGYTLKRVGGQYVLVDGTGKTFKPGDVFNYTEKYDTGTKSGGFQNDFYDKYKTAALGYYNPELSKQFGKAKDNLTFDHARAGTLTSTMAGQNLADLVYQNDMNQSQINSKVDNAVGDLRNSVASQKQAAINQLYATEDPGLAANSATNSVRTLQNTTPEYSALGEMFKNAIVGASGYASAYNDSANWGTPPGYGSSGRTVT